MLSSNLSRPKQRRTSAQIDDVTLNYVKSTSQYDPASRSPYYSSPASPRVPSATRSNAVGPSLTRRRLLVLCVALFMTCLYLFSPSIRSTGGAPNSTAKPAKGLSLDVGPTSFQHKAGRKYLGYNTHSGYHNQRIALENALTLAKLTNRTLLLPPVRLGSAVPWISYDKMRGRLQQSNKIGLEHCKDFKEQDLLPRECMGYYDWTEVHWKLFVDVKRLGENNVVDRWDESDTFLKEKLNLDPSRDVRALKESDLYTYRFYDSPDDREPLVKFRQRVELQDLQAIDAPVLQLGSMFGTSRLRTVEESNWEVRSANRQAMVFHNPTLNALTDHIRDRLGGTTVYLGVHMRLGDGIFREQARSNVELVWREMLIKKLKLKEELVDAFWTKFGYGSRQDKDQGDRKRTNLEKRSSSMGESYPDTNLSNNTLTKRASNSRPQRPGAYKHPWPAPPPLITSRASSPLDPTLTCRRPLHTNPSHYILNYPLFLATDSRNPPADPLLAPFFDTFPCTFVLSDFDLSSIQGWTNAEDGVDLTQFMFPVVDMMISAKARYLVGTPGSTFSRFASDILYQSYHGWDIIERG